MEEDRNLARLATFEYEFEAVNVRNVLNEVGIPAWITGGDGVNTFGAGLTAAGLVGVDINVRQIDLEHAKTLLSEISLEEEKVVPAWTCICGETVDEGFAVCWSCGKGYGVGESDEGYETDDANEAG